MAWRAVSPVWSPISRTIWRPIWIVCRVWMLWAVLPACSGSAAFGGEREEQLIDAARRGALPEVKRLLAEGADPNGRGRFDITPLWQACWKKHHEVARVLLEAGADPNIGDQVWKSTPLMMVQDPDLITLLVQRGAAGGDQMLRAAVLEGSVDLVKAILAAGNTPPEWLVSAKAHAQAASRTEIEKLLDAAAGKEIDPPPRLSAEQLARLTGTYEDERLNRVQVLVGDGHLQLQPTGGQPQRVIPRDEHTFDWGPMTFRFEVRDGRVVAMSRSAGSAVMRFERVQEEAPSQDVAAAGEPAPSGIELDDAVAARDTWPSFRGPSARGIAVGQNLPGAWDAETGRGVAWKTPLPGLGNSSPVIWKDRIFVTTAVSSAGNTELRIGQYGEGDAVPDESEHRFQLYCLDHASGKVLWEQTAQQVIPPVKRHLKSSQANPTPATNGERIVALFNSGGLYCYDLGGQLQWSRDLGRLDSGAFNDPDYQWGYASSPLIVRNLVLIQCDLQKGSHLTAYDLADGSEVWSVPRDEIPSWGTPTFHEDPLGTQVITNGTNFIRGNDLRSGEELWRLSGNSAITVPTPIVAHDLISVTSGYRPIQPIFAIRLDARGDISLTDNATSNQHVAWSTDRGGPYLPTPIVYGNYLYTCANNGILTCYNAKTGEQQYRERLARGDAASFSASPVAADGVLYFTSEAGTVYSVRAGARFEFLGSHPVGEYCMSTPAIAGGRLLLRTQKQVIAIGANP